MIERTSGEVTSLLPRTVQAPASGSPGGKTSKDPLQQNDGFAAEFALTGADNDGERASTLEDDATDETFRSNAETDNTGGTETQTDLEALSSDQADVGQIIATPHSVPEARSAWQSEQEALAEGVADQISPNGLHTASVDLASRFDGRSTGVDRASQSHSADMMQNAGHDEPKPLSAQIGASTGKTSLQDQGAYEAHGTLQVVNVREGEEPSSDYTQNPDTSSQGGGSIRTVPSNENESLALSALSTGLSRMATEPEPQRSALPNGGEPVGSNTGEAMQRIATPAEGNLTQHRIDETDILRAQSLAEDGAGLSSLPHGNPQSEKDEKPVGLLVTSAPAGVPLAQEQPIARNYAHQPSLDASQAEALTRKIALSAGADDRTLAPTELTSTAIARTPEAAQNLNVPKDALHTLSPSVQTFAMASLQDASTQEHALRADTDELRLWPHLSASGPLDATTSLRHISPTYLNSPDLPRHVVQQLVGWFKAGPDQSSEIFLNPAELGRVRISLQTAENGVVINILADRPETLDLLRRNADLLTKDFQAIGYGTADFNFAQGDHSMERRPPDQSQAVVAEMAQPEDQQPQGTEPVPDSRRRVMNDRIDIRL